MPIYSYECKDCGEKFDMLVGVGAGKEELKCKKCSSKNIKRIPATFSTGSGSSSSSSSSCPTGTCNLG
ncbi:MAG: hypothetical protein AUJ85_04730 [Elusimicrobia bacterium CG1_02_37_114]|nr:MAG: hypothetical protein AUJ85_04730 [Elusimicrobia bacterium CG1_02_37_114]PIV53923.1 MAG: FmdB family transcriptional regulator [Elusimicrobia bacterium CG02_land_8_20_14_3_00_37_13]PIZ13086.1 MAG: FmdB family transcriptional regulator [Elusimicrobia bacterium CG_4_10_14_0_8_um_filter_37_32]